MPFLGGGRGGFAGAIKGVSLYYSQKPLSFEKYRVNPLVFQVSPRSKAPA